MNTTPKIGVMDGGVGGFTVLKELLKVCPDASYLYCGDSVNTPYSEKPKEDTVRYICEILDFMKAQNVDAVVVACNAMSSLYQEYCDRYEFPIIDIISPVTSALGSSDYKQLTILSTRLTKEMGLYPKYINDMNPDIKVDSISTMRLPMLLNNGPELTEELRAEIQGCLDEVEEVSGKEANVVMACTHFPLVKAYMQSVKPEMKFIDPAQYQAEKIVSLLNGRKGDFKLEVCTNGETGVYEAFLKVCNIDFPYEICQVSFAG